MARRFRTLIAAAVLVSLPLAVLTVAESQRHVPLPVTAAMHRHYFQVGKRECEQSIKQIETQVQPQGGEGQLLGFRVEADVRGVPKEFQHAVSAGCQSASG